MHYVAIGTFSRDALISKEILSRRRNYTYPSGFKNVQSYLDAQGGRAVIHFETDSAESILRYTADWPELTLEYLPGCSFGEGLGDLPGNWAVNAQGSCGILAPVHRMRCGQHCIESRVGSFSVPRSRSCRAVLHQQTSGAIYSGVCNRDDHNIANLITDLTHFCDREGHNFRGIIRRAMRNWEAERRAEGVLNGEPGLTLEWQGRPVTFQGSDDSVLHARVKGMACCFAPETATGAHVTTIV